MNTAHRVAGTATTPLGGRPLPWRIPKDVIDQVRERADILAIVSARVQLKKSGSTGFVGLCPFHTEKSGSFSVAPIRGTYHCFGCGAHGDAVQFLMEHDGLPFLEALRDAAASSGVRLPDPPPPPHLRPARLATAPQRPTQTPDPEVAAPVVSTAALYAANERAAQFFREELKVAMQDPTSRVRSYVEKRGLSHESLERFEIGYAPAGWRNLAKAFESYENDPTLVAAGLVRDKLDEEGGKPRRRYDMFRDRLIFPLRDGRGRVLAFGGRALGDGEADGPKYLNSPESPVFSKSNALYGFLQAREGIRRAKMAIAVEGYMDVVMLHQHGVNCAVACMGTALTKQHVERLMTQSTKIVFSFDGDAAGQKAAARAMETVLPFVEDHHDLRFLLVPDGQDPDEMVQAYGAQKYLETVARAPGLSAFMVATLRHDCNELVATEDRARFAARANELIDLLPPNTQLKRLLRDDIQTIVRPHGAPLWRRRDQSNRDAWSKPPRAAPIESQSLWEVLTRSIAIAPVEALAHRDEILVALDCTHPAQRELGEVLRWLDGGDDLPVPAPAPEHERLVAVDTLQAAPRLINAERERVALAALRIDLAAGRIDANEFFAKSRDLQRQ